MDDFASAAMIRVLAHGMAALGLEVPAIADASGSRPARVGLDVKRTLVEAAVRQGGLACLPRLGRGVRSQPDDPTHRALVAASDGIDVLERWCRLERYVHSVHRTELRTDGDGRADLRHVSLRSGHAPSAAEDLVVLGVLAALLEEIGLRDVRATIEGATVLVGVGVAGTGSTPAASGHDDATEALLRRLAGAGRTGAWTLHWRPDGGAPRPPSSGTRAAPQAAPLDLCGTLPWPEAAQRCARDALADPLRPRTLAGSAAALGLSARSLQRVLSEAGLTWTEVMAQVRLRAASWWLLESSRPIAEVGFLAGYSDQPHFTREFGRRIGLPPGRYREHFGRDRRSADRPGT
ncbi:MAG: AraC family transcriptional regulator [Burkholderiales bacterium]|nr:MAG: AraC family transcriptional regulator [Burkholderiales bacterium]